MVVRLSGGGWLEMGEGQSVVRLDRRGQVVEVVRPGDSCYGYWLSLGPAPVSDEQTSGRSDGADGG
ncbi:MAG TPA: hypothetical protein VMV69_04580 [Pirellulales bacterium]|nr:hypothetical protein [Pirellulales bacterium]